MKRKCLSLIALVLLFALSASFVQADVNPKQRGDVGGVNASQMGGGSARQTGGGISGISNGDTAGEPEEAEEPDEGAQDSPTAAPSMGSPQAGAPSGQTGSGSYFGMQADTSRPWLNNVMPGQYLPDPPPQGAAPGEDVGPITQNPGEQAAGQTLDSQPPVADEPAQGSGTRALNWFADGQKLLQQYPNIRIYDIKAGISWGARYINGKNHADIIPASKSDAERIQGGKITGSYVRRPVLVMINGVSYAGSMYAVGHGETSYCSYFKGVMCIHFTGSQTHGSKKVDQDHQNAIGVALTYGK